MKAPALFTAIDHPAIACTDVKAQIDWYCRMLDMRVIASNGQEPPGVLMGYNESVSGGAMIELMPVRDPGPKADRFRRFQPGLRHLALRVANFDRAYAQLAAAGVEFVAEPGIGIGGGKVVSFRDPEGNELQIIERPTT